MDKGFKQDPLDYFTGIEAERAVALLRKYQGFTGAWFDRVASLSPPDEITPADVAALTLLDVSVPRDSAQRIYESSGVGREITERLQSISREQAIWTHPQQLERDGAGWELDRLLRSLRGVGRTKSSKLMAAKRPDTFPVYDRYVSEALYHPREPNTWELWISYVADGTGEALRTAALDAAVQADVGDLHLSALRVIDVVVWMRSYGDSALANVPVGEKG